MGTYMKIKYMISTYKGIPKKLRAGPWAKIVCMRP